MDNLTLLAYKNRLLKAGIRYAVVQRNLRELQDHHRDLQQQALTAGLSEAEALAAASHQLGDLEHLVAAMIERPELRSKLHRFPVGTTVVMPLLVHFLICAFLLLALLLPAVAIKSIGLIDLMNSHHPWITNIFELLKVLLMYIVTPIVGSVFAFISIRSHVPKRFWLTGLVLVCLLGSSLYVQLEWPDPETGQKGVVGVNYEVGHGQPNEQQVLTYTLRFTVNLILCGCFAWYYRRKEQSASISGKPI